MKPIKYVFLHLFPLFLIYLFSHPMVAVMMTMKALVVLVHVKNDDHAFSLLNSVLVSLYVCFSFAVKLMCVCVFVCLFCTKREEEKRRKETLSCTPRPRTNSFVCNICINLKLSLSFFLFSFSHTHYSVYFFGCIFFFFSH
jgi:hypothetical protein